MDRVTCAACGGERWKLFGGATVPCGACDGTGTVRAPAQPNGVAYRISVQGRERNTTCYALDDAAARAQAEFEARAEGGYRSYVAERPGASGGLVYLYGEVEA